MRISLERKKGKEHKRRDNENNWVYGENDRAKATEGSNAAGSCAITAIKTEMIQFQTSFILSYEVGINRLQERKKIEE